MAGSIKEENNSPSWFGPKRETLTPPITKAKKGWICRSSSRVKL
jgi:hypothetical protein